jgi:recombination protein RecA
LLSNPTLAGTGGLPRGRVVEMYGPESSGKTTVALHVIAEAQKMGAWTGREAAGRSTHYRMYFPPARPWLDAHTSRTAPHHTARTGGTCVFIDAEHALDPGYARRLGVDVDNLYISQPDNGEQALDIAETLIKSGTVDCVVRSRALLPVPAPLV